MLRGEILRSTSRLDFESRGNGDDDLVEKGTCRAIFIWCSSLILDLGTILVPVPILIPVPDLVPLQILNQKKTSLCSRWKSGFIRLWGPCSWSPSS